jgi:hypothetical protein
VGFIGEERLLKRDEYKFEKGIYWRFAVIGKGRLLERGAY